MPLIGIICFVLLYLYSSTLYPGGNQADLHSTGFDWTHNYWCNLMNESGMNGVKNNARPFAIAALIILCVGIVAFIINFASAFCSSAVRRNILTGAGIVSMILAGLIFTKHHDLMIILSSFFGLIVVFLIALELSKTNLVLYKLTGIFCLILLGTNNFIYYSKHYIIV